MVFSKEADFEEALIKVLINCGWSETVLKNYTEQQLIQNWADILFENNRGIDCLNEYPLTSGEMQQILEQINSLKTPLKLNGFINGGSVAIKRDNPHDELHFGKEVHLKIYNRQEIAAGRSRYQIVQQPEFSRKSEILNDRRGDLMLLINGMPVIHIELKRSGVYVSEAYNQIEKYSHEGIFTGFFSLIQVFVAMNPDEAVYFANPGPEGKFNPDFYFHWANFYNEPINDWKQFASSLLSIPMAHQLIGFYTVADNSDGTLKVMRSYQYYAANAIFNKILSLRWEGDCQRGGFIWHTTGSGKTMTSFKSAQLIASYRDADKVIFLMDRIELGTQSLREYCGFADESETIQGTENTGVLVTKLKSSDPSDTLIVTSIQKMSNIKNEPDGGLNAKDIELMNSKRIVFIVDECHRSTFGCMLQTIKSTFPKAVFFGFTGTPIKNENSKKMNTTSTVFGNELHRYSIANGIRDKNVLGFDLYKVLTFQDKDVRTKIALEKAKAKDEDEAMNDPAKGAIFYEYMDPSRIKMAGFETDDGEYIKGIEDYIPNSQYQTSEHQEKVVEDIKESWKILSRNGKFHALFATSSIPEAIHYYRLIKKKIPEIKVTCLFDPNIDNRGGVEFKEDGLVEIIKDYNERYGQNFTIPTFAAMKRDISLRLAHKGPYENIEECAHENRIDILIVVDQMLTGYDSKWINALYLDKVLRYENIIQAFSRTNRIFGHDKPFGIIRYYRRPHTMERNINEAVKSYSGDEPTILFVEKLKYNLEKMNEVYSEILDLFTHAGIPDFMKLPDNKAEKAKFASLYKELNSYLDAASVQGFKLGEDTYAFKDDKDKKETVVKIAFDKTTYLILAQRYKELSGNGSGASTSDDVPYDLVGYLTEINTGVIDAEYMNSRFEKYLKLVRQGNASDELINEVLDELHKTFATLTQEEQKYANAFLLEVQSGEAQLEEGKTLRDYITDRQFQHKNDQINRFARVFDLDESKLREMMNLNLTESNINEFGRFNALKKTVNEEKAKAYFEAKGQTTLTPRKVNEKTDKLLREFILSGGFDVK